MELEESVFAPEILYKISFYPLKRPKDNHKLKTTPLELRNLTISRNHSHQSKLSLSFGDKKKKKNWFLEMYKIFQEVYEMSLGYLAILDNKNAIKDNHSHDPTTQGQTWRGS